MPIGASRLSFLAKAAEAAPLAQRTAKTLTVGGNAQIDTAQYKFGGSSMLFDGTDDYVSIPTSAGGDLDFGSNDFTIEAWIRLSDTSGVETILSNWGTEPSSGSVGDRTYYFGTNGANLVFYFYHSSGTIDVSCAGAGLSATTWHHVAVVGDSSNFKIYIDGTQVDSTTRQTIDTTTAEVPVSIGLSGVGAASNFDFNGHIDELRVSNNTRYTSSFTPSTTPFVNDSNTLLLVHADGTDADTVFIDDNGDRAPKGIQAISNAQIDTAQSKFGGSSLYIPQTTNNGDRLDIPDSADWISDTLTLECWVRLSTTSTGASFMALMGQWGSGVETTLLAVANGGAVYFYYVTGAGLNSINSGGTTLSTGTWYHIAATFEKDNQVALYIDGTQVATSTTYVNSSLLDRSIPLSIGHNYNGVNFPLYNAHIDEVRVSNTIRYTTGFTAPTEPFVNDSNTLLLLHAEEGANGTTEIFDDNGQTLPTQTFIGYGEDASPYLSIMSQVNSTVGDDGSASTNPSGKPWTINYSTDGVYMVVGISASPYCEIYKRDSNNVYTKLSSPFDTAPSSQVWQAQFNDDGSYLYMSTSSSPYIYAYSRSGDSFTKLSNPSNLPTAQSRGCAVWENYIAIAQLSYSGTTNVHLYKNTSGSISRVDSDSTAAGRMISCSWSHDGVYLGVTMNDFNPRYAIYKRSGDSLTLLTTPLSVGATAAGRGLVFDPTGNYLAFMSNDTDSLRFYSKDSGADTWTYLEAKQIGGWDNMNGAWSKDGRYFFCASQTSPYFYAYERQGNTFVLLTSPTMPNGGTVGVYPNHYYGTA